MESMISTLEILKRAKAAAPMLATLGTEQKNRALSAMADRIEAHMEEILAANAEDIEAATGKIGDVMIDRLRLTRDQVVLYPQSLPL